MLRINGVRFPCLTVAPTYRLLITNEEDYTYKLPRLTQEKRSRWRFLAKKKLGIEIKSAAAKRVGRSALYGTGIDVQGRKLKSQIAKQSALDAERIYTAIVDQRKRHLEDPATPLIPTSDLVFDPQPREPDWERILSQHTEHLLQRFKKREASRSKSAPKPDILRKKSAIRGNVLMLVFTRYSNLSNTNTYVS